MRETELLQLPPEELRPNPHQPRRAFDRESLLDLAESIRLHGILQPLTVRRVPEGWELIAGERRLRAAILAGLETVPCLALEIGEREQAALALIENLQRRDLHYFEEAEAMAEYLRLTGLTREQAALHLSLSPSALANKLRLLRLGEDCRRVLTENGLSERHARALLTLTDEAERLAAARYAAEHRLTVAQTEAYAERRLAALQTTPPRGRQTYIIKDVRLFLNSLDRGLKLVREAGIAAEAERQDTEDAILLTIRLPKKR